MVLAIVLLSSCVDQNVPIDTFRLINETEYEIIIYPYAKYDDNGNVSIISIEYVSLASKEIKKIKREYRDSRSFYESGTDSLRIVFNAEKVLILSLIDNPSNTAFNGDDNREHIITQSDYESAIPCDRDCN